MITTSPCIGLFCGDRQLANNGKSTSVDARRIPVLGEHARTVKVDTLAPLSRREAERPSAANVRPDGFLPRCEAVNPNDGAYNETQ